MRMVVGTVGDGDDSSVGIMVTLNSKVTVVRASGNHLEMWVYGSMMDNSSTRGS